MPAKLDFGLPAYPGRVAGYLYTTQRSGIVIYWATVRTAEFRQRMFRFYDEMDGAKTIGRVHMDLNSEADPGKIRAKGGDLDLMLYDAVVGDCDGWLIAGNGNQTNRDPQWDGKKLVKATPGGIYARLEKNPVVSTVSGSLREWRTEEDPPQTARIAVVSGACGPEFADFGMILRPRDSGGKLLSDDVIAYHTQKLNPGEGCFVGTYGIHSPPYHDALPPDVSAPERWLRTERLDATTPEQAVEELWRALPKEILVGVVAGTHDSSKPTGTRFAVRNVEE